MKQLTTVNCVSCGGQGLIVEVEVKKDKTFDDGKCPLCGIVFSGCVLQESLLDQKTAAAGIS